MKDIVREATEADFQGKDTIIVVGAVTGKAVKKTAVQMARRDDNGFDTVTRPMGAELYYLVDRATADDLTSTDLFFSSVRPASGQLLYKLRGLEPVIVHTTGLGARRVSTNFGYRESNEFEENCQRLRQVMEQVFGAKGVRTFCFKTAHNSGGRFSTSNADGQPALEDWGTWYEATDVSTFASGRGKRMLRPVRKTWRDVIPALQTEPAVNDVADFDAFFAGLRPKTFSLSECDGPVGMMDEFCREAEQMEFDFGGSTGADNPDDWTNDSGDAKSSEWEERRRDEEWRPVYDAVHAAEAQVRPFPVRRVMGYGKLVGMQMPGPYDDKTQAVATYFDTDGNLRVSVRYVMFDPLDEDFYEKRHELLGKIAAGVPKGFVASFAEAGEGGSRRDFIGDKLVLDKEESRESGAAGVDVTTDYDVVETLVISPVRKVDEANGANDARSSECSGPTEAAAGSVEVDFPAWALDYIVNRELGSVSRTEKFAVDKWVEMMDREGYDTGLASYGEDEFFSSEPEFGLPCDCVKAVLPKRTGLSEAEPDLPYPDYSGNAHKNVAKAPSFGTSIPKSAKFAVGVSIKPLSVERLLDALSQGPQDDDVMFIQRKMHGPRSSSKTLDYAHPFRIAKSKVGAKAVVLFDEISFPTRRLSSGDRSPSTVADIAEELRNFGPSAAGKGVGIAYYSNRGQAIKAVYDAYFKEGRFYMETKQNTVGEAEEFDPVAAYLV